MADDPEVVKQRKSELIVLLMTIAANLFFFAFVILMFNKIRAWRGDDGYYREKMKAIDQNRLKMDDIQRSRIMVDGNTSEEDEFDLTPGIKPDL